MFVIVIMIIACWYMHHSTAKITADAGKTVAKFTMRAPSFEHLTMNTPYFRDHYSGPSQSLASQLRASIPREHLDQSQPTINLGMVTPCSGTWSPAAIAEAQGLGVANGYEN